MAELTILKLMTRNELNALGHCGGPMEELKGSKNDQEAMVITKGNVTTAA